MDAAGGEIQGKIPGQRLTPPQQLGTGVIEGVVGGAVVLPPAGIPQNTPAAHLLRRSVKQHRGIFRLFRGGAPEKAVVQIPQGGGRLGEAVLQGPLFRLGLLFFRRRSQPGQGQKGQHSARGQLDHAIQRLRHSQKQNAARAHGAECPDAHRDRGGTDPGQGGAGQGQPRHRRRVRRIPQKAHTQPHCRTPGGCPDRLQLPDAADEQSGRQTHARRHAAQAYPACRQTHAHRQQQGQTVPAAQQQIRDRGGRRHAESAQAPQLGRPGDEIRRLHQQQQRRRQTGPEGPAGKQPGIIKGDAAGKDENGRRQLAQACLKRQKQKGPRTAAQHAAKPRQARACRRRQSQGQRGAQAAEAACRQQARQGRPAQGVKQPPFLPGQRQKFHGQALLFPHCSRGQGENLSGNSRDGVFSGRTGLYAVKC